MVGRDQFYAAFAGAKTTAFFCRACMERTMQLRDDVAVACGRMMYSSTSAVS